MWPSIFIPYVDSKYVDPLCVTIKEKNCHPQICTYQASLECQQSVPVHSLQVHYQGLLGYEEACCQQTSHQPEPTLNSEWPTVRSCNNLPPLSLPMQTSIYLSNKNTVLGDWKEGWATYAYNSGSSIKALVSEEAVVAEWKAKGFVAKTTGRKNHNIVPSPIPRALRQWSGRGVGSLELCLTRSWTLCWARSPNSPPWGSVSSLAIELLYSTLRLDHCTHLRENSVGHTSE